MLKLGLKSCRKALVKEVGMVGFLVENRAKKVIVLRHLVNGSY